MAQTLEQIHDETEQAYYDASFAKRQAYDEYLDTTPKTDEWHAARKKLADACDATAEAWRVHHAAFVKWENTWGDE